jgi:4-oxalocrotonate tautomerase
MEGLMPIINVKISGARDAATTAKAAAMLMDLTSGILGKKRELIAIAIQFVDRADWFIAGRPLSEWGLNSFSLDIKITDETNTKDEKADYIRRVFEGFAGLLGDLHEESYIHVEDVRAAAYGYGGKTQEFRYQLALSA